MTMSCVSTRIGRRVGDLRRAFRGVCTDGVAMCARGCTSRIRRLGTDSSRRLATSGQTY